VSPTSPTTSFRIVRRQAKRIIAEFPKEDHIDPQD
jgi:hypothetical protein